MDQIDGVTIDTEAPEDQHLDNSVDNGDISSSNPPVQPAAELDWKLLYAQSVRERQERDTELERIKQQLNAPKPEPEEDITDEDIERYGTTGVIKKIVAQTLRKELTESLGDIREISGDFKRNKMMDQAEVAFFTQFPHLAAYRDTLAPTIRGQLQGAKQIDPNTYATQAFATIGYYTAMNAAQPAQTTQAPVNSQAPRQVPPNRTNGTPTPSRNLPRLSELERTGMKRIGLDPQKPADVQKFLDMINNDEGITV